MVLILVNNLVAVESAFVFSYLNYSKLFQHYWICQEITAVHGGCYWLQYINIKKRP